MSFQTFLCMTAIAIGSWFKPGEKPVIDVLVWLASPTWLEARIVSSTPSHLMQYVKENPAVLQRSWINGEPGDEDWGTSAERPVDRPGDDARPHALRHCRIATGIHEDR